MNDTSEIKITDEETHKDSASNGEAEPRAFPSSDKQEGQLPGSSDPDAGETEDAPSGPEILLDLPEDVEELQNLVTRRTRESQEHLDDLKRTMAEFANYRRRVQTELQESRQRGQIDFISNFLSFLDDLDQAVKNADNAAPEKISEGVRLLQQKVRGILKSQEIEVIEPTGEPFDPEQAEALTTIPSTDLPDNHVIETYAPCYRFKGRVIRPAKVVVSSTS